MLVECGKLLQRGAPKLDKDGKPVRDKRGKIVYEPYKIRVFNTINFSKSMHFNPFAYMRLILKLLSLPLILVTWIVYAICRLFVIASGAVLGVLAGLVFMASIVLFFKAGVIAGLSWLAIAFLISPYGLPMATAWLTGKIGGLNYALRDFLAS